MNTDCPSEVRLHSAKPQVIEMPKVITRQARVCAQHRAVVLFRDYGLSVARIANREKILRLEVERALRAALGGKVAA